MKGRAVSLVEPIARVERQKLQFGSLRQIRGLINDQAASLNTCLDGHVNEGITRTAAQQALAAVGA